MDWSIPVGEGDALAVRESLHRLIAEGIVEASAAADGRVRYRLSDPIPVALSGLIARAGIETTEN